MTRKTSLDTTGVALLLTFALAMALNQVAIKLANDGFQPVFLAGLRSALTIVTLGSFMIWRGVPFSVPQGARLAVLALGVLFGVEFILLFLALDLTTVGRASILFYTMPLWVALGAHLLISGERITGMRLLGLAMAFGGVVIALAGGATSSGEAGLTGDILALLGALCWAGIALVVRVTSASSMKPVQLLFWQVTISAPILLGAAMFFGPFLRDPQPLHWALLAFQVLAVVSGAFLLWFWLLTVYSASSVTSFSFLTPVLAVLAGWALLGETLMPATIVALVLVVSGLLLSNRPAKPAAPPRTTA